MGNMISMKYKHKQKNDYAELLNYIEKLNTENNKQKDELLKLKVEYQVQTDKLLSYMHDVIMIENSLHTALSFIHSSRDIEASD